ncbi:MAG: glycosyltransferase family 2 protein [Oligoflexales bacterium]|nr:glycosyltransferase family 2 protein [Oligoflexales bacterium]
MNFETASGTSLKTCFRGPQAPYAADMGVLVVMPAFNNSRTVGGLIERVRLLGFPLLVVNDGSHDDTETICKELGAAFISHPGNLGKGAAIRSGYNYAIEKGYGHIAVLDADGQFNPDDICRLIDIPGYPPAIVIGDRRMDGESAGDVPFSSRFGRIFSNFWVFVESGRWLSDTQSGFRLYPLNSDLIDSVKCSRYDFEIEILVKAMWRGISVNSVSVPVFYPERKERVSHFRPFVDNFRISMLHTKLVITRILRIFKPHGIEDRKKEIRGARFMAFLYRCIGPYLCYLFCVFPLLFYFVFDRKARAGISIFYRNLTGKRGLPWHRGFSNFIRFGQTLIDRLTLIDEKTGGRGSIVRYVMPRLEEDVVAGSIFIGAHYGDWLISSAAFSEKIDFTVQVLIDEGQTPKFQSLLRRISGNRMQFFDVRRPQVELVLSLKECVDRGDCLCILADRKIPGADTITLDFLGKPAHFHRGPFELAGILGRPVYFFTSMKMGFMPYSPYGVSIWKLDDGKKAKSGREIAEKYVQLLSSEIRKDPSQWFNFYDFWM